MVHLGDITNHTKARISAKSLKRLPRSQTLQGWYKDSTYCQTTSAAMAQEVIWQNFEPSGQLTFENKT